MKRPQLKRMTIVIAVCALVGALAGIAGSAAAPSSKSKSAQAQKKAAKKQARALRHGLRHGLAGGPGFRFGPVHAEAVIPKADGSGFVTVTTDAGTLNSVDGTTVHVKEGTDKKTYKDDVAIDVGNNAKVIRNHADAKLSDLKAGDHVRVITGAPQGNLVIAEDDAFIAQEKKRFGERGFRHHGFGPGNHDGRGGAPGADPGGSNQNGSNSSSSGSGTNS
jgi:type II secretory pathway pseudopilin PulG